MNSRFLAALFALGLCAFAQADTIVFKNGDKLTGKIGQTEGGKMKIVTAVAGEVTVDLKDVATFSTDAPIDIRTSDGKKLNEQVAAAENDQVKGADGKVIQFTEIAKINPPAEVWTGAILVNGQIQQGNSHTMNLGVGINATLRRDSDGNNDRTTLLGAYNYGRQRDVATGNDTTTTDNWMALGKYDHFIDPKIYWYGLFDVDHDRVAALNYRLAPGVGVGYQWVESPAFNFNTEAGLSYVYEDYINDGQDDHIAFRLAYHLDKKLSDKVSIFHNMEVIPAFEDPSDYNMTADAGIQADLTTSMFSQFKVLWQRDTSPAPGAQKNDLTYTLSIGWKF